jgi:PAS domain S-box-containing protein
VFNSIPVPVFYRDNEGRHQRVNQALCDLMGLPEESILGKTVFDFNPPEKAKFYDELDKELIQTRGTQIYESEALDAQGHNHSIIFNKAVHINTQNEVEGFISVLMDISERKQMEETLAVEKLRLTNIIEGTNAGTWEWNIQTGETIFNERWARMLGYTLEELAPISIETWNTLVHPEDSIISENLINRHLSGELDYYECEARMRHKNGRWVWVLDRGKVTRWTDDSKPLIMSGTHQDITDRKTAELALVEEKQRLDNIIEATNVGTWEWNIQTGETIFNERYAEALGYTLEELFPTTSKTWDTLIHPEDREISDRQLELHLKGELEYYECEVRLRHKDGGWIWVLDRGKVTRWTDDGKPLFMYGTHQDITERRQAEDVRRQLEDKFTKAFNISPDAISITRMEDGRYIDVNEGFCRISGYSREESIGKTSNALNLWPDPEDRNAIVRGLTQDGRVENLEFSFRKKSGEIITGLVSANLIELEGKNCILAVIRDISDRKKMEEALRYSEERFRLLFEQMAEGFALHEIIVDENQKPVDYRFLEVNPAFEKQTGLKRADIMGRTVREVLPQTEEYWIETYGKVALQDESLRYENYHSELNRWYSVGAFSPKFGQFAVTIEDITASKQTLLALEESTERFRQVTETINEVFWLCEAATENILYVSPNFETVFGRTCDSFYENPQSFLDYIHPDDVEDIRMGQIALREQGINSDQEYRILRPDGEVRWLHGKVFAVKDAEGRTIRYTGTDEDITERRQLDEALRDREHLLNQIFDILPVGLWIANAKGELVRSNPAGRKIWGAEPLVGQEEYGVFKARRLPSMEEIAAEDWAVAKTINEGVTIQNEMLEIDAFDGEKRTILNSTAPVLNDDGKVQSAVIVNLDITDWMRTEEALKSTQLQFQSLIENAPDGIALLNEAMQFVYVSPAGRKIFGYDMEDSLAAAPDALTHPDDLPAVLSELQKIFIKPGLMTTLQYRFKHKDGSYRWLESIFTNLLHEPSVNGIIINFRDITDRRAAEQKVQEQINELRRWNAVTLGRENRVLELKQEVNRLCKQAGLPPVYGSDPIQEQNHD